MNVPELGCHGGGSPSSTPKPLYHPPKPEGSAPPGHGNLFLDFIFLLRFYPCHPLVGEGRSALAGLGGRLPTGAVCRGGVVNWLPLHSAALNKFINSTSLSASVILLQLHRQGMDH